MRKKLIAIIIGIVGVLAIGLVIYFLIGRITTPELVGPTPESPKKQIPSQLKVLSDEPIFDYWVVSSTREVFYVSQNGKIAKANQNQDVFLSEQIIGNINFVLPSADGQKIIVGFGNPLQSQFSIFDLISNTWAPLPLEIKSLAFSPEGKRLAALVSKNNQTDLVLLDLQGDISKAIIKNFALHDLNIVWLRPDEIILSSKPSSSEMGSAWLLNLSNLNFNEIIPKGNGLMIKWLGEDLGLKLQNQKSSLINRAGKTINDFLLMVLPDKCVLESNSLYCFLFFEAANAKISWPDDYLQKSIYTEDNLYKFDLNNLTKPQIVPGDWAEKTIDAFNPKFLGSQILFLNRYDEQLYGLEISD